MNVKCPQCQALSRVPESARGKKIRCHQCGFVYKFEEPEEVLEAEIVPDPPERQLAKVVRTPRRSQPRPPVPTEEPDALAELAAATGSSARSRRVAGSYPTAPRRYAATEPTAFRRWLWLILIVIGLMLGGITGAYDEKSKTPPADSGEVKEKPKVTFVQALPGLVMLTGIVIGVRDRNKRKQQEEANRQQAEREMLARMSPQEREAYLAQQALQMERAKLALEQDRATKMSTDAKALGALAWWKADQQRRATEDQTKAIREQTEELKRRKR